MHPNGILEKRFEERLASNAFCSVVELNQTGLVFGAGTVLARMTRDRYGASLLACESDRERVLALLSVVCRRSVSAHVLHPIEAASEYWKLGDKALANIRLAQAGLPRLADVEDAYRLYLAGDLLDRGRTPRDLMKELGLDPAPLDLIKYPGQPRDDHGRFASGSASDGVVVAEQDKKGDADHEDLNERAYEQRRRLGLTTPQEDVEHGHPRPPPEPLVAPAEVPKNVLLGLHARGSGSKFNTDLPGGLNEAQKLFEALTRGQTVTTEVTERGVTRSHVPDGTQLRINANGGVRIERPITMGAKTMEVIHFR
ncbi:hypothetical protein [Methyloferula stellata]|uniref:hypothetical protein n=1 Tax=Methyloferula stellata TaxID=876270 RepID=UPI0003A758CA|nr:hypothetical protein [Methyloferula stellata]